MSGTSRRAGAGDDRHDTLELDRSQRSVDKQRSAGRDVRREVSRSEHADWSPAPDRAEPVSVLAGDVPDWYPEGR